MKRYTVITAHNTGQLALDVEAFMIGGWAPPQGGVTYDHIANRYMQAMTYTPPVDVTVVVRDGGGV